MRLPPAGGKPGKERPVLFWERSSPSGGRGTMHEWYRRCCGMDIHKETVMVCVPQPVGTEGKPMSKTYETFRNDLIRMRTWFQQLQVTEIAMESTGVYWRPVWHVLQEEGSGCCWLIPPRSRRWRDIG